MSVRIELSPRAAEVWKAMEDWIEEMTPLTTEAKERGVDELFSGLGLSFEDVKDLSTKMYVEKFVPAAGNISESRNVELATGCAMMVAAHALLIKEEADADSNGQ